MGERITFFPGVLILMAGMFVASFHSRASGADVLEFFTDPHGGTGYHDFQYGDFWILSGVKETDGARLIDGGGMRLGVDEGAQLFYAGAGGNGKAGGAGTLSFKWRDWHESVSIAHAVEWRVDGGAWTEIGTLTTPGGGSQPTPPVKQFTHEINHPGDGVQIRIRNLADSNRVTIGAFSLTGYSLPIADPHVTASPAGAIDFGDLDLFDEGGYTMTITNEGATEDLVVADSSGFTGPDSAGFIILTPLPLTLSPGGSADLELAFPPGYEPGLFEQVDFILHTNDGNPDRQELVFPVRARVVDVYAPFTLAILDDYTGGMALDYFLHLETQFSVDNDQLRAVTGGTPGPEHSFAATDLRQAVPSWTLDPFGRGNSWVGWMSVGRFVSGWDTDGYSVGAVLACDHEDFSGPGAKGYAVVYKPGSPTSVALVRFTQGIRDGAGTLPAGSVEILSVPLQGTNNEANFHVSTFGESSWVLRVEEGPVLTPEAALQLESYSAFAFESEPVADQLGGSGFRYAGWVWAHSHHTSTASRGYFDNLGVGVGGYTSSEPPGVQSITRFLPQEEETDAAEVIWELTFTEPVHVDSLGAENVEIIVTGDGTGVSFQGYTRISPDTLHLAVATGSGGKTLALRVLPNAGIRNRFNHSLEDDFTGAETFSILAPPSISIGPPSGTETTGGDISFPVSYTEVSTITLSPEDVEVHTTGNVGYTVAVSGEGNSERTVTFSDLAGIGNLSFSLDGGTASSSIGSPAPPAGPSAVVAVDNPAPDIVSIVPAPDSILSSLESITITFNKEVGIVEAADLVVGGSPAGEVVKGENDAYTFSGLGAAGGGGLTVSFPGTVADLNGTPVPSRQWAYTLDPDPVVIVISSAAVSDGGATNQAAIDLTVSPSREVESIGVEDFTITGASVSSFSGTFPDYTLSLHAGTGGTVTVALPEGALIMADEPGNGSLASLFAYVYDATPPVLSLSAEETHLFGNEVTLGYTAEDSLSGIASIALHARAPGEDAFAPVAFTQEGGSLVHTVAQSGVFHFLLTATDVAGNEGSSPPPGLRMVINNEIGVPFAKEIPAGTGGVHTYPLAPGVTVAIEFDVVMTTGTLSIGHMTDMAAAGDHGLDEARLAGQFFRLLADGSLDFGSATVRFTLDPSLFGSSVAGAGELDLFHVIRGQDVTTHPAIHEGGATLRADGVEGFSDWYPGLGGLNVGDWMELRE